MYQTANSVLVRTTPSIANVSTMLSPCMTFSGRVKNLLATMVATTTYARVFAV